jgi:hypothetical protein
MSRRKVYLEEAKAELARRREILSQMESTAYDENLNRLRKEWLVGLEEFIRQLETSEGTPLTHFPTS